MHTHTDFTEKSYIPSSASHLIAFISGLFYETPTQIFERDTWEVD